MRQRWNRSIEIDSAQASKAEVPQERPHRGDQFLGGVVPTFLDPIEQKRPDLPRIPLADIFAKSLQHLGSTARIMSERRFGCATMFLKPLPERDDQRRLLNNADFRSRIVFADARLK